MEWSWTAVWVAIVVGIVSMAGEFVYAGVETSRMFYETAKFCIEKGGNVVPGSYSNIICMSRHD